MKIPFYQVDAFTGRVFAGNPAAVCPLEKWLDADLLQSIAAENNLAETAFFVPDGEGSYKLRWFTPAVEVDLCGHATLASAFVLYTRLGYTGPVVRFETRSGELRVTREGELYTLDFPSREPQRMQESAAVSAALGRPPMELWTARDYMAVYESEEDVRALTPDFPATARLDRFAVIATAPGRNADFVSRFFAPAQGVPEDPVTGSAHCTLVPYWAKRLGRARLRAFQASSRGGELECEYAGDRVKIAGRAALFAEGVIYV